MSFQKFIDLSISEDELNIKEGQSDCESLPPAPSPDKKAGRILRTRTVAPTPPTVQGKRKRETSGKQAGPSKRPKVTLDDKKAVTAALNVKRAEIEEKRKVWLHRHRDLFLPLLPPSSSVFDNIKCEVNSGTPRPYTPLHQLDEQPKLVKGGEMKGYQLQGLSFLVWMYSNGMNSILGDEMGLGKTLQTLSLLAYMKENTKEPMDSHLIICPLSVLSSWETETMRWVPSLRFMRIHGSGQERNRLKELMRTDEVDICLTTYETYVAEESYFKSHRWTYLILDEGHRIKHAEIALSQKLQGIGALHRLILTGTPVQNNLTELWGLLHFLYPYVFTDSSERIFKDAFNLTRGQYALPILKAAQNLLATVMIRRTKAVVEMSVPPRDELTVFIPLSEAQRFWTYRLLTRLDTVDLANIFTQKGDTVDEGRKEAMLHITASNRKNSGAAAGGSQWKKLMNLLLQLRKVCDHPYMLKDVEPSPYHIGEHIVASSSKLMAIDKILGDVLPKGERVLIFSQWTSMLDLLEDHMALRNIPAARLDGSTSRVRRALDIRLFQQEVSPHKVFLISTTAGGLGINLTKASTVIMCDSDWNPQNDLQAIARAHRIGQTKTVKVYRLICRASVEDQMLDRIRRKLFLSVKVMGAETPNNDDTTTGIGSSELMDILRRGSSALSDEGMSLDQFIKAPIEEILQESRAMDNAKTARMQQDMHCKVEHEELLETAEEEERRLVSGVAQVKSRLFDGQVVQRVKNNKELADEWRDLEKRARVDRLVVVNGIKHLPVTSITASRPPLPTAQEKTRKFGSEDHCIYCNNGGELTICTSCPRTYHADVACHGLPDSRLGGRDNRCPQHRCANCDRSTSDAGGTLFRCRYCPRALCEDCVGNPIDCIGDILPEFAVLGYGEKSSAYYIKCSDCTRYFGENPSDWSVWESMNADSEKKLQALWDQERAEMEAGEAA